MILNALALKLKREAGGDFEGAAKRFFRKMLSAEPLLAPDQIGTDGAGARTRQPSPRAARQVCCHERQPTTSPTTYSKGLRAATSG